MCTDKEQSYHSRIESFILRKRKKFIDNYSGFPLGFSLHGFKNFSITLQYLLTKLFLNVESIKQVTGMCWEISQGTTDVSNCQHLEMILGIKEQSLALFFPCPTLSMLMPSLLSSQIFSLRPCSQFVLWPREKQRLHTSICMSGSYQIM